MSESPSKALINRITAEVLGKLERAVGNQAELLRSFYQAINIKHEFKSGDLVQWKPGLQNKRHPSDGGLAIVMQVLPEPIYDAASDAGDPYFREPLDILLGVCAEDGGFLMMYYDQRRFQSADKPSE